MQLLGAIAAPATLLTALLFYFGWVRTNSFFQEFGVEASVLRLTPPDYLLRSVDGLYVPLGIVLVAGVLAVWGHLWVATALDREPLPRLLAAETSGVGLVVFGAGVAGVLDPRLADVYPFLLPVCLAVGAGLTAYGRWIWQRAQATRRPGRPTPPRSVSAAGAVLVALLVVLALFWAANDFAGAVGRGRAAATLRALDERPGVVLYSAERLFLQGPGVREQSLPDDPHGRYRYRYEGLRLLIESDERLVLLPAGWTPEAGPAFVVAQDEALRVEFRPGTPG
ncbi:hypothetical protein BJF78_09635 [Pseudonocardia sp. CNS-139]|nr:hypothetical protein BJF78_09635 [Pseudonocardia sp. CNS-139]